MTDKKGKLALLVGGGPAPGINGVISSVTIEAIEQHELEVLGIRDGFKWLMKPESNSQSLLETGHVEELTISQVKDHYLRGGSILGTSRENPARCDEDMQRVLKNLHDLGVTHLVSIGGDDTAFSASQVYKRAEGTIRVAHVPKTIDNDLPLPESVPTFGFMTARHVGVQLVRNLAADARTTSRWYVIVSMGRAAGHLALGIGKAAAATLTIIPEELEREGHDVTIREICDILVGAIIKRRSMGKRYGVAILAEGLLESIGEKGLQGMIEENTFQRYGKIDRDPHGHLRLGGIDFARMISDALEERLQEVGLKDVRLIDKEIGYELRCADPIPFDAEYVRDLGYGAVKFLTSPKAEQYGAIISFVGGKLEPIRFEDKIKPETGRMEGRLVNTQSESYQCAWNYMIRLRKSDFDNEERLKLLASTIKVAPEEFRRQFEYAVRR